MGLTAFTHSLDELLETLKDRESAIRSARIA
jgi:hypothetical protein